MSDYPFFFTWTAQHQAKPFELTGGQGAHFTTADGSTWLDLGALSYQVNAGHGHLRIIDAIKRQADSLCLASPTAVFPAKVELAEKLLALAGPGYSKVLSNLEEVRARGGKIIALATMGDQALGDLADDLILVPDIAEELQPILASVPLQLLAYHFADLKGTDVDQPRNLAKSVTVE